MNLARAQSRDGPAVVRLDVLVTSVAAFRTGGLSGILLDGNDNFGFGLEAPHHVHEVAGILSAQLQSELAANDARAESRFLGGSTKVSEPRFNRPRGSCIHISAHFATVDPELVRRIRTDVSFRTAKIAARDRTSASRELCMRSRRQHCEQDEQE